MRRRAWRQKESLLRNAGVPIPPNGCGATNRLRYRPNAQDLPGHSAERECDQCNLLHTGGRRWSDETGIAPGSDSWDAIRNGGRFLEPLLPSRVSEPLSSSLLLPPYSPLPSPLSPQSETPLLWSAVGGHLLVATALLEAGAQPNIASHAVRSSLLTSFSFSFSLFLSLPLILLQGETALLWSASCSHPELIRLLHRNGANVDAKNAKVPSPPSFPPTPS